MTVTVYADGITSVSAQFGNRRPVLYDHVEPTFQSALPVAVPVDAFADIPLKRPRMARISRNRFTFKESALFEKILTWFMYQLYTPIQRMLKISWQMTIN